LATSIHFVLMGRGPMFTVGRVDFGIPSALPFYLVLGVLCGIAAVAFTKLLYWVEDQFEKLPLDPMWWPAIGAAGLGVIGFFVPRVLGVGYDTISDILTAQLALKVLVLVMIFKSLALVISLGSGTSGGLLAPMFMGSAAMGSVFAILVNRVFPTAHLAPAAFALVAMGAVFGAASRATFTFIIFAFEITRDYNSVLPLMLVSVIADAIAIRFTSTSIMTEKLARRGLTIHQDYEPDVFRQVTAGEVMSRDFATVPTDMLVADLAQQIAKRDPIFTRHRGIPIVDKDGRLAGIITHGDVLRAMEEEGKAHGTVLDAGQTSVLVAYPNELVYHAAARMLRNQVGRLPVVTREDPLKLIGYIGRQEVMSARLRRFDEEELREPGWIGRFRGRGGASKPAA
jgi:CBS domain-containing protein